MKKILLLSATFSMLALGTLKADNPGCGLGSMVFSGEKGAVYDVLAATTNGTSGNQTFGMSTGTMGCKRNAVIQKRKFAYFINNNYEQFAMDSSAGNNSEVMKTAATILNVDSVKLASVVKANFASIFTDGAESVEVASRIEKIIG